MMNPVCILAFYGIFLILCGIASVMLIGLKAKTALLSGGFSGALSLCIAWLINSGADSAKYAGIFLTLALFIVFAWRSAKTVFKLLELIPLASPELKGKVIAFLIISLMAVVSIQALMLQVITW